ncbi:hypothetical protein OG417_30700 [Actinoallomurus sp. NBC_01490]|uniref:hypothetical protein n=1 Tax=Actinoallomurus sp. NBC_01490 TaxID=2903557 RepID=UPI002E31EAA1|nr:hypothetical protein [Actinoallomurus sp. NBC_01490]
MRTRSPRRTAVLAAAVITLASAAPGAFAPPRAAGSAATAAVADEDPNAIVQRIDADLKANDFDAADEEIAKLRSLWAKARQDTTSRGQQAANRLQGVIDQQARRVVDAKIDYALRQSTATKQQGERYWEAVIAGAIRPQVIGFNQKFRESPLDRQRRAQQGDTANRDAEIDVETATAIVEVTVGEGSGKATQILGTPSRLGLRNNPLANPAGKPVILVAPKGLKSQLADRLRLAGVKIVNNQTELRDALAALDRKRQAAKRQKKEQLRANLGLNCPGGEKKESIGGMMARGVPAASAADCSGDDGLSHALDSKDLGGVDFSTLELRYLSDSPGSVKYSFSASPAAPGAEQNPLAALDAATTSTADLRTWLVLNPNKFWVNLNPTEPDRIIDPALGETNAGRALLDADLAMKRTEGRLLNPKTALGERYWNALLGSAKKTCYTSRMWIVPGDVEVREDGSSLYVIKASLNVKAKTDHLSGNYACPSDPAADARNERLEQTLVVPKIVEAVNTAPEYAPIRRAFLARVVAEWIRQRHQEGHHTSFDKLIDSGDIGPAKLTNGWRPRQVFDDYVHSIQRGEFTYRHTVHEGRGVVTYKMTLGGVDFSRLDPTRLSAAQMRQRQPGLPQTVKASGTRPATASDGSIWLGESAGSSGGGLWSRTTGTLASFATGRTGLAILIVVALAVVAFGIRGGAGRRRQEP